jgi:hypothetical protein
MSEDARMQRAQDLGFDTDRPFYHYTDQLEDGGEFSALQSGASGKFGGGVYLSPSQTYGQRYVLDKDSYRAGRESGEIPASLPPSERPFNEGARAIPVYARGNIATPDDYQAAYTEARRQMKEEGVEFEGQVKTNNRIQQLLQAQGFDGAAPIRDEVIIFDPKNIRSTSAEFDPSKADSSNLLSSVPTSSLRGIA